MKSKKSKKAVSYVEIFIAFTIFLFGISIITYFFLPFFKPEYRTALNIIEKNFEKNFTLNASLIKVVVNQTGCIKFKIYDDMQEKNALFFYSNWTPINFSIDNNNVSMEVYSKEFFLINATSEINTNSQPLQCNSPAKVYYGPPIKENFLGNISEIVNMNDYQTLKSWLLPGFALDFNISIYDLNNNFEESMGKPIPKTNVFGREKIYKRIKDNKIELVKVRFYVW